MIVKVCGITNAEDAEAAMAGGATAIGFNFYPLSPRYIAPEDAGKIPSAGVMRVGVFVNEAPAKIAEIARIADLEVAQLHGDERPADYPGAMPVWKAARVDEAFDFARYADSPAEALLLDGPHGGSGQVFDWTLSLIHIWFGDNCVAQARREARSSQDERRAPHHDANHRWRLCPISWRRYRLMRVWYPSPVAFNQAKTSASRRMVTLVFFGR